MAIGPNLVAALVDAQSEFAPLAKSATNPHYHNKFVPLHEVMQSALPVLNKNGLTITQHPTISTAGDPALTTILAHTSGEYLQSEMPLLAAKQDPQGQGSAITYARRYAVMSILGLVGDEDDDGQAASKPAPKKAAAKKSEQPSALDMAKDRLRAAIKASGTDATQFAWVRESTDVNAIMEQAVALENVATAATSRHA